MSKTAAPGGAEDKNQRLPIEPGTPVQLKIEGVAGRLKSVFVGADAGRYVILRVPNGPVGLQNSLYKGNDVVVSYMFQGSIFGFQSNIIGTITFPANLLFLQSPLNIEEHSLRSNQRTTCLLPCKFRIADQVLEGNIVDIAAGGCRCVLPATAREQLKLNANLRVQLAFLLPGLQGELQIDGTVRNAALDASGTAVGIKFDPLEPSVTERLRRYLAMSN